jgi:hypothetical protein
MASADVVLAVQVAISVVIYCVSVSAVPIYNKKVFSGTLCSASGKDCVRKFPFPIATACLQLGFVAIVLGLINVARHFTSTQVREQSWIFGPHFLYKLRHIAPVGVLFGFKYGITNWGLNLVPTGTHLLLQSTDLVWTVIFARVLNKEKLGFLECCAAILSICGAFLISFRAGSTLDAAALGLIVNLLTPIFLALCITTLRGGTKELFRTDNRLGGSVTPIEFTAVKLLLSSMTALILACIMENGYVRLEKSPHEAWWVALNMYPARGLFFLLIGGVFVLVFQVNITWLAGLTSATAVGIVGEVKIVPQWVLNAVFDLNVDVTPLNLAGATCAVLGSVLYASTSMMSTRLVLTSSGFRWAPRGESCERERKLTVSFAENLVDPITPNEPA